MTPFIIFSSTTPHMWRGLNEEARYIVPTGDQRAEPLPILRVEHRQSGGHHGSRYFALDARNTSADYSTLGVLPVTGSRARVE
jgi:hypothetical protein